MIIFNTFFKSIKKYSLQLIIFSAIFIFLSIVMSTMNSNNNNIFEATSLNIAVFDYDNSDLSHALYNYLDSTQNIVNIKDDNETICDELFNRNISYALFIREGFSSDFSLIENVKDTQSTSAYYLDNCISDYLKVLNSCLKAGYSNEEAISLTNSSINTTASMEIINNNTDDESLYFYFKYIPYAFVSVCILTLGTVLIIFRDKNIDARIKCSSMSAFKRNLYLIGCSVIFCLGLWLLFSIVALILVRGLSTINFVLLFFNSLIFMSFCLSLTYFLSFLVHSENVLNMLSNVIGLGFSFLSGIFIPLEYLSDSIIKIAHFLPSYWYILAVNEVKTYASTADLSRYFSYIGIEFAFAVTFLAMSLATSKIKKY